MLQPQPTEGSRQRAVLGDRVAERADAAGAGEVGAPEQHDLADAVALADRGSGEQHACVAVDEDRLDPAAQALRADRHRHGADQADARDHAAQHDPHAVGRERDVAVLGGDHVVGGGLERRAEGIELGAHRAKARRVKEASRHGAGGDHRLHALDGRRALLGGADQNLVVRQVLCEGRGLGPLEPGIDDLHRADQRDRRHGVGHRATALVARLQQGAEKRRGEHGDAGDPPGSRKAHDPRADVHTNPIAAASPTGDEGARFPSRKRGSRSSRLPHLW